MPSCGPPFWGALAAAEERGYSSIAIPAVSTGIFGIPKWRGAQVILEAIDDSSLGHNLLPERNSHDHFGQSNFRSFPTGVPEPVEIITSKTNEKIRLVRALQEQRKTRERERLFVVEGSRSGGGSCIPSGENPMDPS